MPPLKSMLKRAKIETAERRRTCRHSGGCIAAGEVCLVVYDSSRERRVYGKTVALRMIDAARTRLQRIEDELTDA